MAQTPLQVGTIGSTIAAGLHMIYCDVRECDHSQTLDLESLRRELDAETIASPTLSPEPVQQVRREVAEALRPRQAHSYKRNALLIEPTIAAPRGRE